MKVLALVRVIGINFIVQMCFLSGPSFAQEKSTVLKEVVVTAAAEAKAKTASKTNTAFEDVPASVAVIPQDLIQTQGINNVDQSIRNVSGVTHSSSNNYGFFNNYLIRGLNMNFLRDGVA